MGSCCSAHNNKINVAEIYPCIDPVDKHIYQTIININWIDNIESLKKHIVKFNNILLKYNKNPSYILGSLTITTLIIITYLNQCIKKQLIFKNQLKIIINNLQLKYPIKTCYNYRTVLYLDNLSISPYLTNNKQIGLYIPSKLLLNLLRDIARYSKFKLAYELINNILDIFKNSDIKLINNLSIVLVTNKRFINGNRINPMYISEL